MGGRFCTLDQTHSECKSTLVEFMSFRSRNRLKIKKRSSPKLEEFLSPKSREDKKKVFTAIWDEFGRNMWNVFVLTGFFSPVQPALKPRWGNAESRWRDAKS